MKEGYAKVKDRSRDLSVSVAEANVYSLFLVFPLVAILAGIYGAVWGYDLYAAANMSLWSYLLFMVSLALGMVAHELIHGVSWTLVGRMPLSTVELGLQWRTLTPYAHCKGSLSIQAYRIGMVMPGVLLGLLPSIVGIVIGSAWMLVFGALFTTIAGGDFLVLWLIRKVGAGALVEDHPTRPGCRVLREGTGTS